MIIIKRKNLWGDSQCLQNTQRVAGSRYLTNYKIKLRPKRLSWGFKNCWLDINILIYNIKKFLQVK